MAIFGNLQTIKNQLKDNRFKAAFNYLDKLLDPNSLEHKRLKSYDIDIFEKIYIDEKNFALEQTYFSKTKDVAFFESHRNFIDVQFILEGEEIIEVDNISNLSISTPFDEIKDLIKYNNSNFASKLKLKSGDVAIFFPDDAHMPGLRIHEPIKILKSVVKVKID